MKALPTLIVMLCLPALGAAPAKAPSSPIVKKGQLLLSDDFTRSELGEAWKAPIPAFKVEDGVFKGFQARDDHGAVSKTLLAFTDIVIEFSFRFEGATSFNVAINDKNYKEAHAGHICRVAVNPKQIRLGDDRDGAMRNDIFEMRKDPQRREESNKLLEGRSETVAVQLQNGKWYKMSIEIGGDAMRVCLDGRPIGYLKSSGIGHQTKTDFGFTVSGKEAHFDNLRVWSATALGQRSAPRR